MSNDLRHEGIETFEERYDTSINQRKPGSPWLERSLVWQRIPRYSLSFESSHEASGMWVINVSEGLPFSRNCAHICENAMATGNLTISG